MNLITEDLIDRPVTHGKVTNEVCLCCTCCRSKLILIFPNTYNILHVLYKSINQTKKIQNTLCKDLTKGVHLISIFTSVLKKNYKQMTGKTKLEKIQIAMKFKLCICVLCILYARFDRYYWNYLMYTQMSVPEKFYSVHIVQNKCFWISKIKYILRTCIHFVYIWVMCMSAQG